MTPTPTAASTVLTYLGPEGTFTEQAAKCFVDAGWAGEGVVLRPVESPTQALAEVASGEAQWACVAIESSIEGAVTPTFDALALGGGLQIYREVEIPIAFSILVGGDTAPEPGAVRTWSAHPVARPQVEQWVRAHYPQARFVPSSSNAGAALAVARGEVDVAAAPARAGEIYGLTAVAQGVADNRKARTRFVLVGRPGVPTVRTGDDRTSVIFNMPNRPGALATILTAVAARGVDLIRIESRPTRNKMGEYRFHMDMAGHIDDPHVADTLYDLHHLTAAIRFLGSWPMAEHSDQPPAGLEAVDVWPQSTQWVGDLRAGIRPAHDDLW